MKVLCAACKNRLQSEVLYYVDNAVLTMQCNAQSFFQAISGSRRESYTGFIRSWFFWVFVFIIDQINTARGLDNEMRVIEG